MNKKVAAVFAASVTLPGHVLADGSETSGIYAELAYINVTDEELQELNISGVTIDDEDDIAGVFVGYQMNDNVSFEGGILDEAEVSASVVGSITGTLYGQTLTVTDLSLKATTDHSYLLGGKLRTSDMNGLRAHLKAGLFFWDVDYVLTAAGTYGGTSFSANESIRKKDGSDPYYGVGASYAFSDTVSMDVDLWQSEIDDADVEALSASLVVAF